MRAKEFLFESAPAELTYTSLLYRPGRSDIFVNLIKSRHAFTKKDGTKVVLDPSEAGRIKRLLDQAQKQKNDNIALPRGGVDIKVRGGGTVNSAALIKDTAMAGERGGASQEKEKAAASIQPSGFFGMQQVDKENLPKFSGKVPDMSAYLEAGAFKAGQLYNKIIKNPKLSEMNPPMAEAIVAAAKEIKKGQPASIPNLAKHEVAAFRDYATEYLGILALIAGGEAVNFPKSDAFYKHLEKMGSKKLDDLMLYFPKDTGNPLADSMALVTDAGKAMMISSKGGATGKGAAPSLDSLEIPAYLKQGRRATVYKETVEFIETAQQTTSFLQPFELANLISADMMPIAGMIEKGFDIDKLEAANKKKMSPEVERYIKLNAVYEKSGRKATGTPLGKLRYYVAAELMEAVNKKNALPNFQSAVLEILGYNFIQLNTKPVGDKFITTANWPAKVDGRVTLENKYGAAGTGGKLSWKLH
jgi:hypothetical protein